MAKLPNYDSKPPPSIVYAQQTVILCPEAENQSFRPGAKIAARCSDPSCLNREYCFIRYRQIELQELDIQIESRKTLDQRQVDCADIRFRRGPGIAKILCLNQGCGAYACAFG